LPFTYTSFIPPSFSTSLHLYSFSLTLTSFRFPPLPSLAPLLLSYRSRAGYKRLLPEKAWAGSAATVRTKHEIFSEVKDLMGVHATNDGWCASVRSVLELELEGVSSEMQNSDEHKSNSDDSEAASASACVPSTEHVRAAMLAMAQQLLSVHLDTANSDHLSDDAVAKWEEHQRVLQLNDPASLPSALISDEGMEIRAQLWRRGSPFNNPLVSDVYFPGNNLSDSLVGADTYSFADRRSKKFKLLFQRNLSFLKAECKKLGCNLIGTKGKLARRLVNAEFGYFHDQEGVCGARRCGEEQEEQSGEEGDREEGGEAGEAGGEEGGEDGGGGEEEGGEAGKEKKNEEEKKVLVSVCVLCLYAFRACAC
jgi:hypothetical protein